MTTSERAFIPAAGHDWFLPFYDPLARLLGMEQARRDLVAQAALQPLHRVLDIGCGTGTLAILIKGRHPSVQVTGLDPDAKALARARRKAMRAGVVVEFDKGFADLLPYSDAIFDRVFSSMMFHHLQLEEKEKTLIEIRRVLKPGGRLQLLDFGGRESAGDSLAARLFHRQHQLRDNSDRRILGLMAAAGLAGAKKLADRRTLLGTLTFYQGARAL